MPELISLSARPVSAARFGGKAAGLALLRQSGLPVPEALLVEGCQSADELDGAFSARLEAALSLFPPAEGRRFVAVRSSCTAEDGYADSQAGRFLTLLGRMTDKEILQAARQVVDSLGETCPGAKMGVVLQAAVEADYSGVLFSSDPFTYSRRSMLLSYVPGAGDALVSGRAAGWDIPVADGVLPPEHGPLAAPLLLRLLEECKALEARLGYPVDVEWAVRGGALFYLQCRPLASITGIRSGLYPVTRAGLAPLPQSLTGHDKLRIRLAAQEAGALISDAWVCVRNACANAGAADCAPPRSPLCSGYSAVLLHPRHVAGKVVRSFVGDPARAEAYLAAHPGCQVCSAPKYGALADCLEEYAALTAEDYWVTATIVQEIFQPRYTGVLRRVAEGCLLELTLGHFLTKGVVDTSQYLLSPAGQATCCREARQRSWFEIVEGHVLSRREEAGRRVALPEAALARLARELAPFLTGGRVVEFGVLPEGEGRPYLIDYVEEAPRTDLTAADLSSGILSRGRITGALRRVREDARDGLDVHLYDAAQAQPRSQARVILLCDRPNIALLPLLDRYDPACIGLAFGDGSVLCHLAVALREKGIPAVRLGGPLPDWPEGTACALDGETPGLTGKERLRRV